jgi:maltose-binding protein MalE
LIIQSFQRLYPNVTFNLIYTPLEDLFSTYQQSTYLGQGPTLLFGPAKWGPQLFDGGLITDLSPYIPKDYLSRINPAALDSAKYHQALISLPLSQSGVVMFRNTALITTAPTSFTELVTLSHTATKAGVVGSYLERGAYFSSANLLGLGGNLVDTNGQPAFTDQSGLDWVNLLRAYRDAGAVTFNTNWDLDRFKRGSVGIIIDGTWDIQILRDGIGSDNLAIDPWPTYGNGHMSGWVDADSVYLNANISGDDRFAALAFMGYLLDPQVQQRLAELGHIPSVMATQPRDPLIQQAMVAFSNGVAYPIAIDEGRLDLYWNALNSAIRSIFADGKNPADALQSARDEIRLTLITSTPAP